MTQVLHIEQALPQRISMVICLKCYKRWIAQRPVETMLEDLECRVCGQGFVIETGEQLQTP